MAQLDSSNTRKEVIFFTGPTGGLAQEAIKALLKKTDAHIVLAARSSGKAQAMMKTLGAMYENRLSLASGFDMTRPDQIAGAVAQLPKSLRITTVVLGAGGAFYVDQVPTITHKGKTFEKTFFQNVVGAHVTLSALIKQDLLASNAKVLAIGGEGARGIDGFIEKPNFQSVDALQDYIYVSDKDREYNPFNALGASKLLLGIWVRKLVRQNNNISPIWYSPGFTSGTRGTDGLPVIKAWFMQNVLFKIMALLGKVQNAQQGGEKLAAAIMGEVGKRGDVLGAPKGKSIGSIQDQRPLNDNFDNTELQEALWGILETV